MRLILTEPALLAHSQLRYAEVDRVVAEYVAAAPGTSPAAWSRGWSPPAPARRRRRRSRSGSPTGAPAGHPSPPGVRRADRRVSRSRRGMRGGGRKERGPRAVGRIRARGPRTARPPSGPRRPPPSPNFLDHVHGLDPDLRHQPGLLVGVDLPRASSTSACCAFSASPWERSSWRIWSRGGRPRSRARGAPGSSPPSTGRSAAAWGTPSSRGIIGGADRPRSGGRIRETMSPLGRMVSPKAPTFFEAYGQWMQSPMPTRTSGRASCGDIMVSRVATPRLRTRVRDLVGVDGMPAGGRRRRPSGQEVSSPPWRLVVVPPWRRP